MYDDTIAAIATPIGEAALGIVRLSGPKAKAIAQSVFSNRLRDHRVVYGKVRDQETIVDEAMAVYLAAPHTYTRDDMVEFSCHGGAVALQAVLELLLSWGARLAQPGEFTMRAFLNGRIDLAQAEAVLDVIQAKTRTGLQVALQGLEGRLSREVKALRAELLEPLAYLTALVDFPEDEVGQQDVAPQLEAALCRLQALVRSADQGMVYRQGVRTAIVGRPNAGKSSLLNRLLGRERAIVTPVPGTTRDTVEEVASIRGIPFLLVDTAGMRATADPVEHLGVERSRSAIAAADLVLFVVDASQPLDGCDQAIAAELSDRRVLLVANKQDLVAGRGALPEALEGRGAGLDQWPSAALSALTGQGLDELQTQMAALVTGGHVSPAEETLVSNPRHAAALKQAADHVQTALNSHHEGLPSDFVTIDLTAAVNALGEITGETASEDLLELIFSRFCIGK